MQTAKHWIYRLDEVNSERDQEGWVKAIQKDAKEKPMATARKLKERVKQLEKELADMTMNYTNTRHQYDLRQAANEDSRKQNDQRGGFGSGQWFGCPDQDSRH